MNLSELKGRLDTLADDAQREFQDVEREADLVQAKNRYLGRKGHIKSLGALVGQLSADERPLVGRAINAVKNRIEAAFAERMSLLQERARQRKLEAGRVDVTLPGRRHAVSAGHPLVQIQNELLDIFRSMGFAVATGPEIESDLNNFERLNFPDDHPARDMQDTFLIAPTGGRDDLLLRTHTSPVQVRTVMRYAPPVQVVVPGVVYRHDYDPTHSPVFRQIEGLHVGHNITMRHLKGTLTHFLRALYGPSTKLRLRPSFFPFTEPSAEVDIQCVFCKGDGCRVCSHTGWLEVLGSGMVDPNVFSACGYDPDKVTGYAFGLGVERIAMLKLGIRDIRYFYENDLRFLEQY
ncbi:MAG: phenylalanine--tRNA ligase subunit alpha [Myxococcota bacterium]